MKIRKEEALTKINKDCNIFVFVAFQGCILKPSHTLGTIVSTSISTCGVWCIIVGVQVSIRKVHTHIQLD